MNRRSTGDWRKEMVAPGCVSLLTHAAQSHWRWSEDIEVTHLYLSPGAMADVAAEAYDCHIKDVELRDILKADDPVLAGFAASLAQEAREAGLGGRLYVDSPRTTLASTFSGATPMPSSENPTAPGGFRTRNAGCSTSISTKTWTGTYPRRSCRGGRAPANSTSPANSELNSPARRMLISYASASNAPKLNWPVEHPAQSGRGK